MNTGKPIFAQLIDFLPIHHFRKCVKRYNGQSKVRSFSCWDQFLCLAFAQLTYRESLRDIEVCLRAVRGKLYHLGFRGQISRSTLADANEQRDYRIFADFAQVVIHRARKLYADESFDATIGETIYALDATIVDLCLSLFPWAAFRRTKAGVKLHTLLDLRGNIPSFIRITNAIVHDVNILDVLVPEPGSYYVMDRGYLDFARLYRFEQEHAFFLIRAKSNLRCHRLYSRPVDKTTGLICDQTIVLDGYYSGKGYPEKLRRVRYFDEKEDRRLTFLTNNFSLPALTIAQLYRRRWQIELFFKWIKQHLRIKTFYGTSSNAIHIQIWTAVTVYVLVALVKKQLCLDADLYTILQVLSVTCFEKTPILQALAKIDNDTPIPASSNQLRLFD
jgi:hypothetical protein